MTTPQRPVRADVERTERTILEAAERVLSANPAATIEQVAEAAGVARTTVHRRFATREVLLDALTIWANEQFRAAIDAARPESAPPLVVLYEATANVLRVKIGWRFAMTQNSSEMTGLHPDVVAKCDDLLRRAQETGLLRADVDLVWARRVYYALMDATVGDEGAKGDPDMLATRIVRTLLHGLGTDAAQI